MFCHPVFGYKLTSVQILSEVCEPVLTSGLGVACQPRLDYGRAMLMGAIQSTSPGIVATDDILVAQHLPEIIRNLPGLQQAGPGPDVAVLTTTIATAIARVRFPNAAPMQPSKRRKTVMEHWSHDTTTLWHLCGVELDDLPLLWTELANAKRGEEHHAVEMVIHAHALECFRLGSA